jgi:RNA polymerase sigma factor (sigma-70 family)
MNPGGRAESDEARFRALFDDHYVRLRGFARRRVEEQSAVDDVLAETFAVAWRRLDAAPDAPLPWLFSICTRVIANQNRSARRRRRLLGRLSSTRPASARDVADAVTERSTIAQALGRLSDTHREALRLLAWDGLTTTEAAAVMDCTPATFRVRLHRARTELAKHLRSAGHEGNGPAAAPEAPTPVRNAE